MFISVEELKTHLYSEIVHEVARYPHFSDEEQSIPNDPEGNEIAKQAILTAISEASSYMSRYDVQNIFNQSGSARDAYLVNIIKDIAVWHFIALANPNVELVLREKRYDSAIDYLTRVQSGKVTPNWPYLPSDNGQGGNSYIKWNSNQRRNNHY